MMGYFPIGLATIYIILGVTIFKDDTPSHIMLSSLELNDENKEEK